jgi:hypothetical protein
MGARIALGRHWPEYLIEAAGLGLFMIAAGCVVMLAETPAAIRAVANSDLRRRARRALHRGRGADFRHEPQPGTQRRLGAAERAVARHLALLAGAAARHAGGCRT